MFWIEFRDITAREHVRLELDDLQSITNTLHFVVQAPDFELIDFSNDRDNNLDGALDYVLTGVKLFPETETKKAA